MILAVIEHGVCLNNLTQCPSRSRQSGTLTSISFASHVQDLLQIWALPNGFVMEYVRFQYHCEPLREIDSGSTATTKREHAASNPGFEIGHVQICI